MHTNFFILVAALIGAAFGFFFRELLSINKPIEEEKPVDFDERDIYHK